MKNVLKVVFCNIITIILIVIFSSICSANNLTISNVELAERTPSASTVVVQFDVSWESSWRTKINHDAIWLTIRLYDPAVSPSNKKLCQLTNSGLNSQGLSTGTNSNLEMYVPADLKGVFLRPSSYGMFQTIESTSVQVTIDYDSCGFANSDQAIADVLGIEMVYIPQGAFYAGDHNTSTASLNEGSSDTDPWYINSASVLSVTNPSSNGYRYVSAGQAGEDATGTSFVLSADYPKGFNSFYVMKYELTEALWVKFLNSLPTDNDRVNRDLTDGTHKNTDTVLARNTISCTGSPLACATQRPYRALSYISWMDLSAFLDWAALRPMSELEFEKLSRGPLLPTAGEFAWGTANVTAAATISGSDEDGTESILTTDANAHFNNTTLSGGDSATGPEYDNGPLRSGIFATGSSSRISAGAGYYGVMELSGNLKERLITIGNSTGRLFTGTHGDGVLTSAVGFEGNATNTDWAGIDGQPERGVTGAAGSGFRGGAWDESGNKLRISDRSEAARADTSAVNNAGGRGVRTYDGN